MLKKLVVFIFVLQCFVLKLFAQDTLRLETNAWIGSKFYIDYERIKINEVENLMIQYPEANKTFTKARASNTFGTILSMAGGFLIGWPIGGALAGGEPNWVLLAPGFGLIGASIPLSINGNKKLKKSVVQYNENLNF